MKTPKFIPILASVCLLSACNTWERPVGGSMWERGDVGAADWKTNAGRGALSRITRLDPGCTTQPCYDADYIETAYNAIGQLLASARPESTGSPFDTFDSSLPVIYASTVDLNDYSKTTAFGRLMAEALATGLNQHWRSNVVKVTLRQGSMPVTPRKGEFLLSRDMQQLAVDHNAGAVMVSTYTVAIDRVYVNVELINVQRNTIVASTMFDIPHGPRTEALLRGIEYPADAKTMLRARNGERLH